VEPGDTADCPNAVDFALAYGAALAPAEKANSVSLRNDHMPYLGKKRRLQNNVRFLSISLTTLLLAVGVFFHAQLIQVNKQRKDLQEMLEVDYRLVMLGERDFPPTMKKAVDNLAKTLRSLQAEKQGIWANQESVYARLTLILQSLNACARQTGLEINAITITTKDIIITGATSSRQNTVNKMTEAMKGAGLEIIQSSAEMQREGDKDVFTIMVAPVKRPQGA
jgi:hypothetical protein